MTTIPVTPAEEGAADARARRPMRPDAWWKWEKQREYEVAYKRVLSEALDAQPDGPEQLVWVSDGVKEWLTCIPARRDLAKNERPYKVAP